MDFICDQIDLDDQKELKTLHFPLMIGAVMPKNKTIYTDNKNLYKGIIKAKRKLLSVKLFVEHE